MYIDEMELFTRVLKEKDTDRIMQLIKLTDKKTGNVIDYPLYNQKDIKGFKNSSIIKKLDMTKLEVEYDYETDDEQQRHSKRMLLHELS